MKIEVGSGGIQGFPYLIIVSAWDQHELVGDRIFLDILPSKSCVQINAVGVP